MKARVHFTRFNQKTQTIGGDEHMLGEVVFDIEVDGQVHRDMRASVKQVVGTAYNDKVIEVSPPFGYKGPWNHAAFQPFAAGYATRITVASGAKTSFKMAENTFYSPLTVEFDVVAGTSGW
jgi:hypothetical protein